MVSMINLDAGFDPYGAYTSVLKRSAHIKTEEDNTVDEKQNVSKELVDGLDKSSEASKSAVNALKEQIPPVDISDISESLKGIQDFSFIGKNSEVKQLDAKKAVSDMQRDDVLSQYQYFVGSAKEESDMADGLVLQKM